jgi:hypothetical protein
MREIAAGGMPANEDAPRIAAVFVDVRLHPGEGGGSILHIRRKRRLRTQPIVDRCHGQARCRKAPRHSHRVLTILHASHQPAAVKPDQGRKGFLPGREIQVELAPLFFVVAELVAALVGQIGENLDGTDRFSLSGAGD